MDWHGKDALRRPERDDVVAALDGAVARCAKLPVLDRALQRVLDLADSDEATVTELVAALEQDPGLAANVLRYAGSAAAGARSPIRTVRQAVTRVGRTGVRRLALDSVAFRFFEVAAGTGGRSLGHLHLHAIAVSRLAVRTADLAGVPSDAPHLAGLLHDCGRLVLPGAFGQAAVDAVATAAFSGTGRAAAERDAFGADHAQAGALLAAASGVGDDVLRAIAFHHGGDDRRTCPDRVTACVQLADQVAGGLDGAPLDDGVCRAAMTVLGLPDEVLDELALAASGAGAPRPEPVRHAA